MTQYVYILQCKVPKDSGFKQQYRFYTGRTKNIHRRLKEHKSGRVRSTRMYNGDISLVYLEKFNGNGIGDERSWGMQRETLVKKWNREKKRRMINTDYNLARTFKM